MPHFPYSKCRPESALGSSVASWASSLKTRHFPSASHRGGGLVEIRIFWIFSFGRPLITFRSGKGIQILSEPKFLEKKSISRGDSLKGLSHQSPPSFIQFLGFYISKKVVLVNRKFIPFPIEPCKASPPFQRLE